MKAFLIAIVVISATKAVSTAANIINPAALFDIAYKHQEKVTELEREISSHITGLRAAVTDVLKASSNATLNQIDSNVNQIFELDRFVRDMLFDANVGEETPCIRSLRTRLNAVTEFSGYESSVCVARHDRSLNLTLSEINGLLQRYEGTANSIHLIVVRSFISLNIWTQPDDIETRIVEEYEKLLADWNTNGSGSESLVAEFYNNVEELNGVLIDCFEGIRSALMAMYERFARDLDTCREFDNTRLSPVVFMLEKVQ